MSYTLETTRKPGYLHVKVTGKNSPESVKRYLEDVFGAVKRHHATGVLVEEHLTGPSINALDMIRIATGDVISSFAALRRIAYVDTNPEHAIEDMAVAEDILHQRGLHVRIFRRVREAETWMAADIAMRDPPPESADATSEPGGKRG